MANYRFKDTCTSDTAVLAEAIKASYPVYSDDAVTYIFDGVHFEFSGDSVSYVHYTKSFGNSSPPKMADVLLRLPTCETNISRDLSLDFGLSVFLVLCFLMGFMAGGRGHD